jgi:hypothetical protein
MGSCGLISPIAGGGEPAAMRAVTLCGKGSANPHASQRTATHWRPRGSSWRLPPGGTGQSLQRISECSDKPSAVVPQWERDALLVQQ